MRLFIAVNIPDALKDGIGALQDVLKSAFKSSGADVRWVEKDNLHLTLKFLGESSGDSVPKITGALKAALRGTAGFRVVFAGLGTFPSGRRPKIVWVGIKDGADLLKNRAAKIEDALFRLGFEKEIRGFSPHLTIGRVRSRAANDVLLKGMDRYACADIGGFDCARIDLMESVLKPSGPEYKCVNSISIS